MGHLMMRPSCRALLAALMLSLPLPVLADAAQRTVVGERDMHIKVGISQGDVVGDTDAVIQQAIDAVSSYGGGTVELGPGTYTLCDSVRLASRVRLVGSGRDTVLRK